MVDAGQFAGIVAGRDADVINLAGAYQSRRDGGRLFRRDAAHHEFVARNADPEDRVGAERIAHCGEDLARKEGAAIEVTAIAVGAPVHQRRQEAREQHAMRHGDLDPVEVAGPAALGRGAVEPGDLREFFRRGLAGRALRDLRARPRGAEDSIARRLHGADMGELGQHQAALRMDGGGEATVARHDAVVDIDQRQPVGPDLRPEDGRRPRDLHAEPSASAAAVIIDVALARQAVLGKAGLMGRQVDAAAQPLAAQVQRLVDLGKGFWRGTGHRALPSLRRSALDLRPKPSPRPCRARPASAGRHPAACT